MHQPVTHSVYLGPLRKEVVSRQTVCLLCLAEIYKGGGTQPLHDTYRAKLSADDLARGAWMCERHADPEGYLPRLRAASEGAKLRCLRAYPICQHCGSGLSQAQVDAGQSTHPKGTDFYGCRLPTEAEPLAQRSEPTC